jgi:acyl-CoA reductase-like NAD-dependent aldehyde dehydrogenase
MWRLADLIEQNGEELQCGDSDNGKPLTLSRAADIPLAADCLRYMAGWATKTEGTTLPLSVPGHFAYTLREPVGVVGQIIPWISLPMAVWK